MTTFPGHQKTKAFIWGASGHAQFVLNIISLAGDIEIVGFIDDVSPWKTGESCSGLPVLGGREVLPRLLAEGVSGCVFGFGNCSSRLRLGDFVQESGFSILSALHPNASIAATAKIGAGVVIGPSVVVDADCVIEDNCILNNSCCISHGTQVGRGTHICPGVTTGGNVHIGSGSWIGIGSNVLEKVSIGSHSYIGAGSLVTKQVPDGVLAYGAPARVIRKVLFDF
jgi:UDP-N-acetylbacillosamine N-acetyltransferase